MNHDVVNNRLSQLPIAMAGIVHAFHVNGTSLSIFNNTASPFVKSLLP